MVGLQGTLANPAQGTKDVRLVSNIGFDGIDLISSDATKATVARGAIDHNHMTVALTGLQPDETTVISAVDHQNHSTVYATLHLFIKPRIARTVYPFAVSNIDNRGSTTLVPTRVADSATLQARLEQIYGVQSNVHFTVNPSSRLSVHYDLNGDGAVQTGGEESPPSDEVAAIVTGIFDFYHCITIDPNNPCSIDNTGFFPAYVHRMSQDVAIGFRPTSNEGGTYLEVIGDLHNDGTDVTTSHEIGHSLGMRDLCPGDPNSRDVQTCIRNSTHEVDRIMWHFDGNPGRCRLIKSEWQIIQNTLSSH